MSVFKCATLALCTSHRARARTHFPYRETHARASATDIYALRKKAVAAAPARETTPRLFHFRGLAIYRRCAIVSRARVSVCSASRIIRPGELSLHPECEGESLIVPSRARTWRGGVVLRTDAPRQRGNQSKENAEILCRSWGSREISRLLK